MIQINDDRRVKLISSLFWPGVVIAAIYLFRAQIEDLVRRVRPSKITRGARVVEFATFVRTAGQEVGETASRADASASFARSVVQFDDETPLFAPPTRFDPASAP